MPNKTFVVDTGALVLRAITLEIRCLCDLIWISQIVDPDACGSNCCFYQCELLLALLQGSSQTSWTKEALEYEINHKRRL